MACPDRARPALRIVRTATMEPVSPALAENEKNGTSGIEMGHRDSRALAAAVDAIGRVGSGRRCAPCRASLAADAADRRSQRFALGDPRTLQGRFGGSGSEV